MPPKTFTVKHFELCCFLFVPCEFWDNSRLFSESRGIDALALNFMSFGVQGGIYIMWLY